MPHYSNINTSFASPTLTQSNSNSNSASRYQSDPNNINSNPDNVFAAMLGVLPPPPERDGETILTIDRPVLSTEEEQEKWLAESLEIVNTKHRMMLEQMKTPASFRYIETSSNNTICTIEEYGTPIYSVLRIASEIFAELRTSALPPHLYYELYMRIFDCTHELYVYLEDELIHKNINTEISSITNNNNNNNSINQGENYSDTKHTKRPTLEEVYEKVQYVGSIVPRLYLLIIIGSLYISYAQNKNSNIVTKEHNNDKDDVTLEILQDLLEMCKGVQHPTRGLFLRHFLLTMMKNKLPGDVPLSTLIENAKANLHLSEEQEHNNVQVQELSAQETNSHGNDSSEEVSQEVKEANWLNEGGKNAPSEESINNTNNTNNVVTPVQQVEEYQKENYQQAVLNTANLLIQNLREMNWLWIRMEARRNNYYRSNNNNNNENNGLGVATSARRSTPQQNQQQSSSTTTGGNNRVNSKTSSVETNSLPLSVSRKTFKERSELKVLVGMNIVRISQLDGIDVEIYKRHILPKLLTVIVKHREPLAQQYLFEVIIQVFPDEFHLESLHLLLDALFTLTIDVDVGEILRILMDRLGKYVCDVRDGLIESNLSFSTEITNYHHNTNNLKSEVNDVPPTNTPITQNENKESINKSNKEKQEKEEEKVSEYPSTDITHTPHHNVVEYLFTVFLTSLQSVNILYDLRSIYGNVGSTHGNSNTDAKDNTNNNTSTNVATINNNTTMSIDRSIRRSASIPPRTPILFGAYVNTMASLALLVVKLTAKPALEFNKHNNNNNVSEMLSITKNKNNSNNQQLMQTRITYFTQILQCVLNKYKLASPTPATTSSSSSSSSETNRNSSSNPRNNQLAVRATVKLMSHVMEYTSTLPALLSIHPFISLHRYLPFLERRRLAMEICEGLISHKPIITTSTTNTDHNNVQPEKEEQQQKPESRRKVRFTSDNIHALLSLMQPLIEDANDAPNDAKIIYAYDVEHGFIDEQVLMCKVMHVIMNNSLLWEVDFRRYIINANHTDVVVNNNITKNDKPINKNVKKMAMLMNNITLLFIVEDAARRGGARRIKYTFPTLISIYLQTASKLIAFMGNTHPINSIDSKDMQKKDGNEQDELQKDAQHLLIELYNRLFRYSSYCVTNTHETNVTNGLLNTFAASYPIECFQYLLQAAEVAMTSVNTQEKSFACFVEACTIYEIYASELRVQMDMLHCLINALIHRSKKLQPVSGSDSNINLEKQQKDKLNEEQEKLTFRVIQYCGKVLHKADHARLLVQCAHMFTTPSSNVNTNNKESKCKTNVNECVERALAIASQLSEQPLVELALHVDLLNLMLPLYTLKNNYALGDVRLINFVVNKIGQLKQEFVKKEQQAGEMLYKATVESTSEMESKQKKNVSTIKNTQSRDKSNAKNAITTAVEGQSALTIGTNLSSKSIISGCEDALSTSTSHIPITWHDTEIVYKNIMSYIAARAEVDEKWKEIKVIEW